jgi:hypothetical protein
LDEATTSDVARQLQAAIFEAPMSEDTNNTDEIEIKALLEAWADAVRRHDLPAILARHEPDMVMFDLPPPLQCKGIDAYKGTWALLSAVIGPERSSTSKSLPSQRARTSPSRWQSCAAVPTHQATQRIKTVSCSG